MEEMPRQPFCVRSISQTSVPDFKIKYGEKSIIIECKSKLLNSKISRITDHDIYKLISDMFSHKYIGALLIYDEQRVINYE